MSVSNVNLVLAVPRVSSPVNYSVYGVVVRTEADLSDLSKTTCWLTVDCLGSKAVSLPKRLNLSAGDRFKTPLSNWSSAQVSSSGLVWLDRITRSEPKLYSKNKWLNRAFTVGRATPKGYLMSVPSINQGFMVPGKDTIIVSDTHTTRGRTKTPRFPYSGGSGFFTLDRFRRSVFAWRRVSVPFLLRFLREFKNSFSNNSIPNLPVKWFSRNIPPLSRWTIVSNARFLDVFFTIVKIAHKKSRRYFFSKLRLSGSRRIYKYFVTIQGLLKRTEQVNPAPLVIVAYKFSLASAAENLIDIFILYAFLNSDFSKSTGFSTFLHFVKFRTTQRRSGNKKLFETLKPAPKTYRGRRKSQFYAASRQHPLLSRKRWRKSLNRYLDLARSRSLFSTKQVLLTRKIGFVSSVNKHPYLPWKTKGWKRYVIKTSKKVKLTNSSHAQSFLLGSYRLSRLNARRRLNKSP